MARDFNYVADLKMDRAYGHKLSIILTNNSYMQLHLLFEKYKFLIVGENCILKQKILLFFFFG